MTNESRSRSFTTSSNHGTTTSGDFVAEMTTEVHGFGLMPVRVELEDDGSIIVYELSTGQFGVASAWQPAVDRLAAALATYLDFLSEQGPERLSSRLAEHLEMLSSRRHGTFRPGSHGRTSLAA